MVHYRNFGIQGHTFSIQENSLLEHIQSSNFNASNISENTVIEKAKNLKGVVSPKPATDYRVHYLDLTFQVENDIKDQKGKLIVKKRAKINPLAKRPITSSLLFLDGTDSSQIEWATQQKENDKWILVRGDPLELEEKHQRPVFFDQQGYYTRHFRILSFPSKVSQDGLRLKVEEIPIEKGRRE